MEIKRKCDLEILSKQPLALVLMQIRFSPVPLIENYMDNIQASLTKIGYPLFERNDNLSVEVSPKGINTIKGYQWTFKSADQRTNIILDKNQLSFQTTKYSVFEEFYEDFNAITSSVFELIEDFKSSNKVKRIGLRYIDQIIPQNETDTVSSYINSTYTVSKMFAENQINNLLVQSGVIQIEGDISGFITVKFSEGKNGIPIPPELMARAPLLPRTVENGTITGIIDIDHSYIPQVPEDYDENQLKLLFYRMHDNTHSIFKQIVSEEGIRKWI